MCVINASNFNFLRNDNNLTVQQTIDAKIDSSVD